MHQKHDLLNYSCTSKLPFSFIAYELLLIFVLFQSAKDARKLLKFLDENLGEPIPEKDYGGNCRIYDFDNPTNPYHNIFDKVDIFISAHAIGYWCKTLIFRDWWFATVISVMFEFLVTVWNELAIHSEMSWVGNIWFFSPLILSKWEILQLSQLYTFWGKSVYFSIFEWWNSQLCFVWHNGAFKNWKINTLSSKSIQTEKAEESLIWQNERREKADISHLCIIFTSIIINFLVRMLQSTFQKL